MRRFQRKRRKRRRRTPRFGIESLGKLLTYVDFESGDEEQIGKGFEFFVGNDEPNGRPGVAGTVLREDAENDDERGNERSWFKIQLKLCKLWLKWQNFAAMGKTLKELEKIVRRREWELCGK